MCRSEEREVRSRALHEGPFCSSVSRAVASACRTGTCGTFACRSACIAVVRLRDSSQKSADLLTHLLRPNCVARGACANHSFAGYISPKFLTQSFDSCISVWAVHSCRWIIRGAAHISRNPRRANHQLTCLTGLGVESQTVKLLMHLLRNAFFDGMRHMQWRLWS